MASSFSDILECPVCLCVPNSTPILQCASNGHIICNSCVTSLRKICPVCRQATGFTRCLTAEKLLSLYLVNPAITLGSRDAGSASQGIVSKCRFHNLGCTNQGSERHHEVICRFRPVHCPDVKCKKMIPAFQVVKKHLTEEHPDIRLHSSGLVKLFRLCVSDEHWVASSSYKCVRFMEFGHSFFRVVRRDDARKSWYFWIYFDGTPKENETFQAEISLLKESKEAILTHVHNVVPLDFGLQELMANFPGLMVTDDMMRQQMVTRKELYLSISIKKKRLL